MPRTLLETYPRRPDRYDEMIDAAGQVRPHWRQLFRHLDLASPESMRQRLDFAERCIQENGVAYNVYADPQGQDRPWALDPLPVVLPTDEWRGLAEAVAQRARLLNAVLADLYGEQKLLAEGLLPPALVFGQHGFLWPCLGVKPPGGVFLHHYAVDLARSPDGHWWVIGDRTQAPSGAGYALENRLIVSRVFPELFRDLKVEHLAAFFGALQQSLEHWAPVDAGERPLVVVLTPGPYNETYFEHAYLARYLGFPLVEGQDLSVRGDTVFLKSLTGLRRVHVIMRRLDDDYCDPLELRGDSAIGVPGLLQVVRAGRVLMSNALGCGLPGSSALMGFLPAIARRLFGEELAMPAVATWWCGERPALEYVVAHFDELVIKPAYPSQHFDPVFGHTLRGEARAEIIRRLRARPQAYVAQEWVRLSQAPVWSRGHERRLLPRSVGLRAYAVATPEGYRVMPGGLSRVAGSADALVLSMQRGGASKDTWVLAEGAVDTFSLLKPVIGPRELVRSGSNLSSRVVENLFWFGRYAERFDDIARLLRVALARCIDSGGAGSPELDAAIALAEHAGIVAAEPGPEEEDEGKPATVEARLAAAIFDAAAENSLADAIRRVSWSAAHLRERLSLDHWHSLNFLQRDLQASAAAGGALGETLMFLDRVLHVSSSLIGFTMDNMTRDIGWRFLILGRRIERLAFLCSAIGGFLAAHPGREGRNLDWLLELADSTITYRSRYSRQPELLAVVDLVVFDDSNPHAVMFQVQALLRYVAGLEQALSEFATGHFAAEAGRLQRFELEAFVADPDAACAALARQLQAVEMSAYALSDGLGLRFFTHVDAVTHQTLAS